MYPLDGRSYLLFKIGYELNLLFLHTIYYYSGDAQKSLLFKNGECDLKTLVVFKYSLNSITLVQLIGHPIPNPVCVLL